jgi:hypothetical protein
MKPLSRLVLALGMAAQPMAAQEQLAFDVPVAALPGIPEGRARRDAEAHRA